jgi:hypothetical protein
MPRGPCGNRVTYLLPVAATMLGVLLLVELESARLAWPPWPWVS